MAQTAVSRAGAGSHRGRVDCLRGEAVKRDHDGLGSVVGWGRIWRRMVGQGGVVPRIVVGRASSGVGGRVSMRAIVCPGCP